MLQCNLGMAHLNTNSVQSRLVTSVKFPKKFSLDFDCGLSLPNKVPTVGAYVDHPQNLDRGDFELHTRFLDVQISLGCSCKFVGLGRLTRALLLTP